MPEKGFTDANADQTTILEIERGPGGGNLISRLPHAAGSDRAIGTDCNSHINTYICTTANVSAHAGVNADDCP